MTWSAARRRHHIQCGSFSHPRCPDGEKPLEVWPGAWFLGGSRSDQGGDQDEPLQPAPTFFRSGQGRSSLFIQGSQTVLWDVLGTKKDKKRCSLECFPMPTKVDQAGFVEGLGFSS